MLITLRTFDKRGGTLSLKITTTEVRNIYMVYQQVISLVTCFNWKLTGKLRCLVTCQNGLTCLSGKYVCFLAV